MLTAVLEGGSDEIEASAFGQRPLAERRRLKALLRCPVAGCQAPSHFRKRSVDGKPALFYSYEHIDGCLNATSSHDSAPSPVDGGEEVDAIWNSSDELMIRLDDPIWTTGRASAGDDPSDRLRRRHRSGTGDRDTNTASIGLRPLLRRLREDPVFRGSQRALLLSDQTKTTIADGCLHADEFRITGSTVLAWGTVMRAAGGWINSGYKGYSRPAIRVPGELLEQLLFRVQVANLGDLNGHHFIVEGEFRRSAAGGPYVTLDEDLRIAFLPAPAL